MAQIVSNNRPKKYRQLLCILLAFFIFLITSNSSQAVANEIATPPLTIAYCRYMPFYFEGKNEQPRGILVDIWKQWSQKTGIPVEFVLLPWEENMDKTESGQIDISALMYHSKERETRYLFSTPLMNLSTFLYFRKNNLSGDPIQKVKRLKDILFLSTGVVAKDFSKAYLEQRLPDLKPVIFQDHESLVRAAINNEVQAFLMEGPVASTYIAKHNGADQLFRLEYPVYTKPQSAGVKQGNTALIEKINKGLALISPEETQAIVQSWTGDVDPLLFAPHDGSVKIASSIDNMPFHFADEQGNAVGYFIDLWKLWSKKTGVDVTFIPAPWAESLKMVKTGQADIHAGCFFPFRGIHFWIMAVCSAIARPIFFP
ncbi:MAG: transporter substrate-binding domain-containing protein [Desulfobacter sp.]|nr:transporter substrate-binding domain-containing protein [Desulfobacter sp.]